MSYYLVRHAQSEHNDSGIFAGSRLNTSLVPEGVAAGKTLASTLARTIKAESIISSKLNRAHQTAKLIAEAQKATYGREVPIIQTSLLNEVDVGMFTGLTKDQALKKYPHDIEIFQSGNLTDWAFPQGETYQNIIDRLNTFRRFLLNLKQKPVIIVAHAMLIRVLVYHLSKHDVHDFHHHQVHEINYL